MSRIELWHVLMMIAFACFGACLAREAACEDAQVSPLVLGAGAGGAALAGALVGVLACGVVR